MLAQSARYRRRRILIVALIVSSGAPAAGRPGTGAALVSVRSVHQPKLSVWDGVYSQEQARRGAETVALKCGYCHSDDLSGGDDPPGPPLKGAIFLDQWYGRTVGDLFVLIAETMPFNAPASLSPKDYAEVLSFILRANGFPPGMSTLPATPPELEQILLTRMP